MVFLKGERFQNILEINLTVQLLRRGRCVLRSGSAPLGAPSCQHINKSTGARRGDRGAADEQRKPERWTCSRIGMLARQSIAFKRSNEVFGATF
jgi:hypothetical protein